MKYASRAIPAAESSAIYWYLHKVAGFTKTNMNMWDEHQADEGFQNYLFWEDMIALAGEVIATEE